jgi:hypothetical protein
VTCLSVCVERINCWPAVVGNWIGQLYQHTVTIANTVAHVDGAVTGKTWVARVAVDTRVHQGAFANSGGRLGIKKVTKGTHTRSVIALDEGLVGDSRIDKSLMGFLSRCPCKLDTEIERNGLGRPPQCLALRVNHAL